MAATKRQMNWANVSFASTPITGVTNASFKLGGKLVAFSADADQFTTLLAVGPAAPGATLSTADVGTLSGFTPGQTGILTAQLNDAKAAAGGAVIFTVANAVFENWDASDTHGQIGVGAGTWQFFSSDGSTPPNVISRA